MYEELLPIWKERCRLWAKRRACNPLTFWVETLTRRGLHCRFIYRPEHDATDCLVQGVMLFTWEAGIEDY